VVKAADSPQNGDRVAACEAFEQQGGVADADGEAWVMVVMGGAETQSPILMPYPSQPSAQVRALGFQIG